MRWSLRARLLAGQIALLTAVCLGIGAATEVALHRYLLRELDGQLLQITQRSSMMERRPPPPRPPPPRSDRVTPVNPMPRAGPGPEFLDAPGQPIGMVAAVVSNGSVVKAGALNRGGDRDPLSETAANQLAGAAGARHPVSVDLDGLGLYRVVAGPVATRAISWSSG